MHPAIPDRDEWYLFDHGLPYPRWQFISGWIRAMVPLAGTGEAYIHAVRGWLQRLNKGFGGGLASQESSNFHLLSPLKEADGHSILSFLERTRKTIIELLGEHIDPPDRVGKHVVIYCASEEAYYQYVSHFYSDGVHPSSGGIFLYGHGYTHIVVPPPYRRGVLERVLIHELTHNLVYGIPLPVWVNEGLAMTLENSLLGSGLPLLNRELVERHHERWNRDSIQEFWMGWSFKDAGDSDLAYSLAAVLLRAIQSDLKPPPESFRRFVLAACEGDAGASAANEHLGIKLSDLAATFLGPGDWEPRAEDWQAIGKVASEREPDLREPPPEEWPDDGESAD